MIDSILSVRSEAYLLAHYKLEAIDKIDDFENRMNIYEARIKIRDQEIEKLKTDNLKGFTSKSAQSEMAIDFDYESKVGQIQIGSC
jgi:hypothetical protein